MTSESEQSSSIATVNEDVHGRIKLKAHRVAVETESQLIDLLQTAWSKRQTQATMKNDTSSRSHAILRLEFNA